MGKNKKTYSLGMVDVGAKPVTARAATAGARVVLSKNAFVILKKQGSPKGDVLETARIAGIMAAKQTSSAIPLCHPLELDGVAVSVTLQPKSCCVQIVAEVRSHGRTGVEMEALYAASVAGLAVYDMMKWADRGIEIRDVKLLSKSGGKSGEYLRGK